MDVKVIVTSTFGLLSKAKVGQFKEVEDELNLLGIPYSKDDLMIAYSLIKQKKTINNVLKEIESSDTEKLKSYLKSGSNELNKEKEEKKALAEKKAAAAAVKKAATAKAQSEKKLILEQAQLNNPWMNISRYTVVREKRHDHLVSSVEKMMKKGWHPIGGVTGVAFGMSATGGNSFAQAMARFKY